MRGTTRRVSLPLQRQFREVSPFSATTEGFGVNHTGSKWAKIEQQGWDNASRGMPEVIEEYEGRQVSVRCQS